MKKRSSNNKKPLHGRSGSNKYLFFYSLLLTVTVVLSVPSCNSKGTAKDTVNAFVTRESLKNVIIALELYRKEFGEYPKTLDELLLKKGIKERDIIEDAWGRTYHYVRTDDSYVIFSMGHDGKPYTKDDIYPARPPA